MKTKEDVLKTIETLKEEILSLQSNTAEKKLSQIKTIILRWFSETSLFDIDSNPDYNCIKESICDKTIYETALMLSDTYDAIYDIVKILDIVTDDD
jgi:hypothetical protein